VALGTVLFSDPEAPARVRSELAAAVAEAGLASVDEAHGLAGVSGKTLERGTTVPA
jgi:hypothetical protein